MPTAADRDALIASARRIGANPLDLATVMSFESGLSPSIRGGSGNRHIGLIQFGIPEQQKYGANQGQSFQEQLPAVESYLTDRGFKPGMGLLDLYSTVNAGSPGRYGASDAANGGTWGTVADKVNSQMGPHITKAQAFLGGDFNAQMPGGSPGSAAFSMAGPAAPKVQDFDPLSGQAVGPAPVPAEDDTAKVLAGLLGGGEKQSGQGQDQQQDEGSMLRAAPLQRRPFSLMRFT